MLAGAYPSRRVRRAQAAGRLGPRRPTSSRAGATRASSPSRAAGRSRTAACTASSSRGEAGTPGRRVGELDEEMVYELRAGMHGDVVVLGASSLAGPGHQPRPGDRDAGAGRARQAAVLARRRGRAGRSSSGGRSARSSARSRRTSAAGAKGRATAADAAPRPSTTSTSSPPRTSSPTSRTSARRPAPCRPTGGSSSSASATSSATGGSCILTPFGGRVHAPWTLAIEARLAGAARARGPDDLVRRRDRDPAARGRREPSTASRRSCSRSRTRSRTSSSAGRRSRRCSPRASARTRRGRCSCRAAGPARARRCGSSASAPPTCSRVASRYGSFPILVETYRECLADVFDLPALREVLGGVARPRDRRSTASRRPRPSPFASILLFDYVAAYMYEGDAPLAERRAQALTLDRDLLRELLGQEELRELLDPDALADLELSLQALVDERQATTADQVHDLLRRLGDLTPDEVAARGPRAARAAAIAGSPSSRPRRRAVRARIGGEERWIAIEDVARYRDGVGVSAAAGRAGGVPRAGRRRARRAARALGAHARAVPRRRAGAPLGPADRRRRGRARAPGRGRHAAARRVPARRRGARVVRSGGAAAAPPPLAGAAAARGRARRSRRRSARFLPAWQGVAPSPSGAAAAPLRGSRRARAPRRGRRPARGRCRSRPRCSSATSCRPASPATSRGCSTSSARWARSPGSGAAASAATTGGSCSTGRAASSCRPAGLPDGVERPAGDRATSAIRAHLAAGAAPRSTASCSRAARRRLRPRGARRAVGPRLGRRGHQRHVRPAAGAALEAAGAGRRAPRPGRLTSLGPPEAAGRWSLVDDATTGDGTRRDADPARRAPSASTRPALALLERHGVLTREAVAGEGVEGGFSRGLPDPPRARGGGPDPARLLRRRARGGPVRARRARSTGCGRCATARRARRRARPVVHLLAAADPANPYGAALPWPRRGEADRRPLQRAAGRVRRPRRRRRGRSTSTGAARSLQTLPAADDPDARDRARRAARLLADGRVRELVIGKVDGEPVADVAVRDDLLKAGFVQGYRGLARRARTGRAPSPVRATR